MTLPRCWLAFVGGCVLAAGATPRTAPAEPVTGSTTEQPPGQTPEQTPGQAPGLANDARRAAVGMRAVVAEVVLPGPELVAAPSTLKTPVVVRVLASRPHGEHRRYDIEWVALEPGRFDLVQFLARADGSPLTGLPELAVEATRTLPAGVHQPGDLQVEAPPRLHGYRTLQIVVAVAWGVGLLAILFVGRRRRRRAPPPPPLPTLADRLRPLAEAVATGTADPGAQAELERLLLAYWRSRLGLHDASAADAIVVMQAHPEAGALLRQVQAWLHAPTPPAALDLHTLLAPYRHVTADAFEPRPAEAR